MVGTGVVMVMETPETMKGWGRTGDWEVGFKSWQAWLLFPSAESQVVRSAGFVSLIVTLPLGGRR